MGGGIAVLGLLGILGKTKTDKKIGVIALIFGVVAMALPEVSGLVLALGGMGLVGYGLYNVYRFVRGLKERA